MFRANIVPGQGFLYFTIYRKKGCLTPTGRPVKDKYVKTCDKFLGMLINASPKEQEQWKQNGHPITHKIVCHGAKHQVKATDYVMNEDDAQFYVQGVKNPAGLGVTKVFYVEERFDLKENLD